MESVAQRKRTGISVKSIAIIFLCVCGLVIAHNVMTRPSESWKPVRSESEQANAESGGATARCKPKQQVVFLKTHKTGSTAMASIIERYGYYRNLTFAVGLGHVLSFDDKFNRRNFFRFPGMDGKPFDILTNHARYDRAEMEAVVADATYITILRKPENQLESAFGYFEMHRGLGIAEEANPLDTFMNDPMRYFRKHVYMWQLSRNGMLYDLGFEHQYDDDVGRIVRKILELDEEFDLVIMTEHFDESLILMKKSAGILRTFFLYLSNGARRPNHRFEISNILRGKLRKWNHGDVLLYEHFNRTFWERVAEYGPTFHEDLDHFLRLKKEAFDAWVEPGKWNKGDPRTFKLTLKNNSKECQQLLRGDSRYTSMIRTSMFNIFGIPTCLYVYAVLIASGVGICVFACEDCCKLYLCGRNSGENVKV